MTNTFSSYYTTFNTFKYLLPFKNEDNINKCGLLPIMHVLYMNDPSEGKVFFKYINFEGESNLNNRKSLNCPNVFMKCFTDNIDYLPMWHMYGQEGEGVCLVVDWEKSKEKLGYINDLPLYHVCYVDENDGFNNSYNKDIDIKYLSSTVELIKKELNILKDIEYSYIEAIITPISYLFKDASYGYEHEVRLIYFNSEIAIEETKTEEWDDKNEFIPKLYVKPEIPLTINKIILGPKFKDIDYKLPYIRKQLEEMCKVKGLDIPKITLSSIDYR